MPVLRCHPPAGNIPGSANPAARNPCRALSLLAQSFHPITCSCPQGPGKGRGMFLSCQGLQFQQMLSRNPCPALFLLWGVSPRISPQLLNSSQTGAGFDFFHSLLLEGALKSTSRAAGFSLSGSLSRSIAFGEPSCTVCFPGDTSLAGLWLLRGIKWSCNHGPAWELSTCGDLQVSGRSLEAAKHPIKLTPCLKGSLRFPWAVKLPAFPGNLSLFSSAASPSARKR